MVRSAALAIRRQPRREASELLWRGEYIERGTMEAEKLQRLHDTLAKLAPRGKSGGLGYGSKLIVKHSNLNEDGTPKNGIYMV